MLCIDYGSSRWLEVYHPTDACRAYWTYGYLVVRQPPQQNLDRLRVKRNSQTRENNLVTNFSLVESVVDTYLYRPQSGALGTIQEQAPVAIQEQITTFNDQDSGWTTKIGSGSDVTMDVANNNDSDLGSFLSRPTRIAEYSWGVNLPLFQKLDPWSLFLNDPRVAEKIANFELYRSKLHVKMVISGTGFHYGRSLVSYNPYSGFDSITTERNFIQADLVQASQKPHFFLNPTNNTGGQLDLPFFWHENYLSLSSADRSKLGELTIKSMTNLQHSNGGDDPVTITVYAWASDLVLTMPTSITTLTAANYTVQSGKLNKGDEYGRGIISTPASAVAEAAGALKEVPFIAPYAKATEMIATGVGDLAAHWGYSRPPVVTDIVQQKPFPAGNLSNTDAADAVQKLSLDSKQEITIDSRTVGLDGEDQMDIVRFCQRESYIDTFSLDATQTPDSILWNTRVSPCQFRKNNAEIHCTPMALMSQPFRKWQGSMKYRFQIVKSNFHKGKILLRWDPKSHGAQVEYNTVYSRVIDIAECDDFEITVGWGQSAPFLAVQDLLGAENYSTTRFATDGSGFYNGNLEVNVVNSLVSPSVNSPIQFNVYVSACEDIKFGDPKPNGINVYSLFPEPPGQDLLDLDAPFQPQSGMLGDQALLVDPDTSFVDATDVPTGPEAIAPIAEGSQDLDHTMSVFFGESPKSIRELCRRYVQHRVEVVGAPTGQAKFLNMTEKGLGYFTGYDNDGIDIVGGIPATVTNPTFAQWFLPCYAGWRGATRVKYSYAGNMDSKPIVSRLGFSVGPRLQELEQNFLDTANATQRITQGSGQFTAGGCASTNIGINDTIEVEIPYYNGERFSSARLPTGDFVNGCHSTMNQSVISNAGTAISSSLVIRSWRSVGEDFTLFFFTGTPILYGYRVTVPEV